MRYLGDFARDSTLVIYFTTNAADGSRVDPDTNFEAADFRIYKNMSAAQRSSQAGYSVVTGFDGMVGVHAFSADLSDDTDAEFYEAGAEYIVVLYPDETVDGESVSAVLGQFSIVNRRTPSVTFTPVAVTVSTGAVTANNITQYQNAAFGPFIFTILDSDGDAVDLSESEMSFCVYDLRTPGTVLWSLESVGTGTGGDVDVGGDDSNQVTVSDDDTNTGTAGIFRYVLWDTTNDQVRARGLLTIVPEATP